MSLLLLVSIVVTIKQSWAAWLRGHWLRYDASFVLVLGVLSTKMRCYQDGNLFPSPIFSPLPAGMAYNFIHVVFLCALQPFET